MSSEEVKYYEITEKEKKILLEKLRKALSNIENIFTAIVYGGFTRRNFFRDIDIAVYTGGLVRDPLRFESKLCLELSKITGVRVDVRIVDEAPAWFKMKILKDGLVIYEKTPGAYTLYVKETVGEFQDIKIKQRYSTRD